MYVKVHRAVRFLRTALLHFITSRRPCGAFHRKIDRTQKPRPVSFLALLLGMAVSGTTGTATAATATAGALSLLLLADEIPDNGDDNC